MWQDFEDTVAIGEALAKLEVAPDGTWLRLWYANDTSQMFDAVGECCSTSYIANIDGVSLALGHMIQAVVHRQIDDAEALPLSKKEQDMQPYCLTYHRYLIVTAGGIVSIEFRNDSNGYYDGWLELAGPSDAVGKFIEDAWAI